MLSDTRFWVGVVAGLALGYAVKHYQASRAAQ
jgi:hypothetical protein